MIAITFALPDESRDFRRVVRVVQKHGHGVGSYIEAELEGRPVLIWHVGIGALSAQVQTKRLLAHSPLSLVICAGYAGALQPGLEIGDIVLDWREVTPPAGFPGPPHLRAGTIYTADKAIESLEEKRRLGIEQEALAVDMESAVIAGWCQAAEVPVIALRSISDRFIDALPVPMEHWFDLERQRPAIGALLLYLATHPRKIRPFVSFVRSLAPARRSLAAALVQVIPAFGEMS